MKNIVDIYLVLSFFIYIIACAVIYMIAKDILNFRFLKKVKAIKPKFEAEILKQLSCVKNGTDISKMDISYVIEKLKYKPYIKVFNNTIEVFNKDRNNHKYTKTYMENFEDIVNRYVLKHKLKDNTLKTYMAINLGEYKLSNYEISEFLLSCINTKSIYLRVTALESIAKIGNINTLKSAIEYVSKEEKYINNKVFTDIINQFGGDKSELDKYLINDFKEFNESLQKVIVGHFKNNKIEFVKEELLNLLKDNISKEINISIVKYFTIINYDECKDTIIELLNNGDWEYRAVCAIALKNYKCKCSEKALLKSINDKNWYVRYNSAISILKFGDKDLINYILENDDKYAKDILFYAMFMDNKISYEEYLEKLEEIEVEYQC
ncbi:HEAT repeat domain-containing protein [Bacillus sp. BAU-SS-2023]|nr:HEAT repeat domain-containing protein [Bacillus sp. BAU-SS-2023]